MLPYALRDSPWWPKSLGLPGPQLLLRWSNVRHWQQIGMKEEKEVGVFITHFFLVLLQFYVVCSPLWPQPLNYFPLTLFIARDQAQRFLLLTLQAEGCYASLLLWAAGCLTILCWYPCFCPHACKKLAFSSGNFFVSMKGFPFKTHTDPFSNRKCQNHDSTI